MKHSAPAPNTLRQFIWMLALIFAAGFVVRLTGGLLGLDYPWVCWRCWMRSV
jgi:hypothetical protein